MNWLIAGIFACLCGGITGILMKKDRRTHAEDPADRKEKRNFRIALWCCGVVLAGIAGFRTGQMDLTVFKTAAVAIAVIGLNAAMICDLYNYVIPNVYLAVMAAGKVILLAAEFAVSRDTIIYSAASAGIGVGVAAALMFLMYVVSRHQLGMGDIKLIVVIGGLCGLTAAVNMLLYGLILSAVIGIVLWALKIKGLKDTIPFGPFLYIGWIITVILQAI